MSAQDLSSDGREVEDLLPFYAAGSLRPAEARRVEAALAGDAELRRRLALVEEEMGATIALNEAIPAPSSATLARLMERIEAQAPRPAPEQGLLERLGAFLAGLGPPRLAMAGLAAALLVAVQGAALIGLVASREPTGFETASSGAQPDARIDLTIIFQDEARAGAIAALLQREGLAVVRGPLPGGLYQLQATAGPLSAEASARLVEALRRETGLIRMASPVR